MQDVVLFGAGLHANVCKDILVNQNNVRIIGIIDSQEPINSVKYGLKVIGRQNNIKNLQEEYGQFKGLIAIGDNWIRSLVYKDIVDQDPYFDFINAIHPLACISNTAKLGKGIVVMPGTIINTEALVEDFCILNTGSQLEHNGRMKKFSHLSAGSITGGKVTIGEFSTITLGVTILDRVTIGDNTVIGSGSLVLKDIPSNVLAYGNPCKIIRKRESTDQFLKSG